jgi:plasmid stability protein
MHKSKAKVLPGLMVFGGWRGELTIDGDLIRIDSADHSRSLEIDVREIKRASFNSNNGLWAIRLKDGRRARFQSAGTILSADRTEAGQQTNDVISALLKQHKVRHFGV